MWGNLLKTLIGPVIEPLIDRIPNPNERARAREDAERQLLEAFTQASAAQTRINEVEAAHPSRFVAGWRPAIGWTCAAGLAYQFVLHPLSEWALRLVAMGAGTEIPPPPALDVSVLTSLVMAMLGMGGLRTYEKMRGVSRERTPSAGGLGAK